MAIFDEKSPKLPNNWRQTSGYDTINVNQFAQHDKI